ncbi:MAG: 3-isopropylmalate dehydratase large subunit, partial [Candidatus Omnitrophica bacterium]|nr:3-isopropylmalate dehydratase large subunit [Candidatus Omnitrophota bacterium]
NRMTICNMAIEAGGKSGIIAPDKTTIDYLKKQKCSKTAAALKKLLELRSDKDAVYDQIKEYNVSKMEPQVACPHLPSNVKPVSKLKKINLDQVVIGSCTNGRITDLRIAASILKGRKVNSRIRLIVIPATQDIYLQADKEGLLKIFVTAGAAVSTPTCGPCLGGHMGILAKGETALATTNRNFVGRMGDPGSKVYLSNPAVAAVSSIKGRIAHPQEAGR